MNRKRKFSYEQLPETLLLLLIISFCDKLMQFDTFQYPSDPKRIKAHEKASKIGKVKYSTLASDPGSRQILGNLKQCSDCGRYATECPQFVCHENQQELQDRYGSYGPNCVIYLGFIKRLAIFLFICTLVFALPMFIINLKGNACQRIEFCISNNIIHNWSLYNVRDISTATLPHIILWFLFCLVMVGFNFYLTVYTLKTYRRINDKNITDSDYCLLLRRLPDLVSEKQLRDLINKQIQRINERQEGFRKITDFKIRDIIMINKLDQTEKSLRKQVKYFRKAAKRSSPKNFIPAELPRPTQFANAALIRFNSMKTNKQISRQSQSLLFEQLLRFFCVFYSPKTHHKINQKNISLLNAPHPSDMLWQNFGFSERSRMLRKVLLTIGAIIVLILSGAASLLLSYWMEVITNNQGQRPVYLTIITVFIVLIFNRIIRKIVIYTTKVERLDTKTDQESQQISLIVFHESLNLGFFSIVVPILVQLPQYIINQTTKSSSFPLVMFTTIIIQAIFINIVDFIVHFFDIKQKIWIWLDNKKISPKTHSQALHKFIASPVPFVKCYAWNVTIIWFGFLYAVITPISIFIAFLGMLLSYYVQRYLFNRKYSIPFYGGPRINYQMIRLLDWTPLIIGLFNLFAYKKYIFQRNFVQDQRIIGLIIIMIVISAINLLIPWKTIAKKLFKKKNIQLDIPYNPANVQLTYQQSNPYGRQTANIIYRQAHSFQSMIPIRKQQIYQNSAYTNPTVVENLTPKTQNFIKPSESEQNIQAVQKDDQIKKIPFGLL